MSPGSQAIALLGRGQDEHLVPLRFHFQSHSSTWLVFAAFDEILTETLVFDGVSKCIRTSSSITLLILEWSNFKNSRTLCRRASCTTFIVEGLKPIRKPLASEIGLRILKQGGNAVDAAIAIAAALNVTEPCSTGVGGDCFLLFYDAKSKQVRGLNGSGRSPAALTAQQAVKDLGEDATVIPSGHGHAVTVPGTVAGWVDAVEAWGTLSMAEILGPAIDLAREGFPVSPLTAGSWERGKSQLLRGPNAAELLNADGQAPKTGEIFQNENLAKCFEEVAKNGKKAFYEDGRIAQAIVDMVREKGGVMTLEDLKSHKSTFVTPISTRFQGVDVHEIPLMDRGLRRSLRLAFADAKWFVSDMEHNTSLPVKELLSENYAKKRATLVNRTKAAIDPKHGSPELSCDTVSFQVIDGQGNAVSMVNSNYEGFGTGLVPKSCGFTLQNRGCNFELHGSKVGHPNALAPNKRPYHTIIPGLTTFADSGELHSSFTVMGGFMQPQGHVQVLSNMLLHGMNPQEALDAPRFNLGVDVIAALREKFGHNIQEVEGFKRTTFGRGQIILRDPKTGVLCAGSDGRADGCAMGCFRNIDLVFEVRSNRRIVTRLLLQIPPDRYVSVTLIAGITVERASSSLPLLFAQQARNGAPAASIAASSPRTSIKGGGVAFHRTTTSSRATAKSNLFALGPGQYDVVPRRPATTGSVKFSPADRFPEHSGGVSVTFTRLVQANIFPMIKSLYYFVPASGFVSPADSVSKTGGGIPNWSRSARFPGRKERFRQISSNLSPAVDYISRNKTRIENLETSETGRIASVGTLVVLSAAQMKLVKLLMASAVLHRLRQAQESDTNVLLSNPGHMSESDSMRALAAALIARGTFRFRLSLRVQRKTRAAKLLKDFPFGSFLRRSIRHGGSQNAATNYFTSALVAPRTACASFNGNYSSSRLQCLDKEKSLNDWCYDCGIKVPLHKLLHLPKQKRWFNARFVLGPDGSLRGYAVPEPDAENTENAEERLVVEVKHFRCHAHGFANLPFGSTMQRMKLREIWRTTSWTCYETVRVYQRRLFGAHFATNCEKNAKTSDLIYTASNSRSLATSSTNMNDGNLSCWTNNGATSPPTLPKSHLKSANGSARPRNHRVRENYATFQPKSHVAIVIFRVKKHSIQPPSRSSPPCIETSLHIEGTKAAMNAALQNPHSQLDIRSIKAIHGSKRACHADTRVRADVVGSDKDVEAFAAAGELHSTTEIHNGKHIHGKVSTTSAPMKVRKHKEYDESAVVAKDRGEVMACLERTEGYLDALTKNGSSDHVVYTESPFFECFRPSHEVFDFLDTLTEQNPQFITKYENVSVTHEGRAIPAFKISTTEDPSKKTLYTQALIHAREWQAGAATFYTMASMIDDLRAGNEAASSLFDKFDWYFVPIVNIDGYQYTWEVDRMWRTNRHLTKLNGEDVGVDLNRNWPPEEYFNLDPSDVDSETYPGEYPLMNHLQLYNLTVPALTIEVEGGDFVSPQSTIRPVGKNIYLGLRQFAHEALSTASLLNKCKAIMKVTAVATGTTSIHKRFLLLIFSITFLLCSGRYSAPARA
ncbi:Nucleophile aminohydrolase [Phytophthora cactorum]|nr:Nucleophile aminohydrolase [Phytophthora cactorum]